MPLFCNVSRVKPVIAEMAGRSTPRGTEDENIRQHLRHIAYSSMANGLERSAFDDLVANARKRNEEIGVRGVIAYDGRMITQILEGEGETVDRLFQTIRRDRRHSGVVLITRVDIEKSQFATFGMANLSPSEVYLLSSAIIDRYGTGASDDDPLILDS